MLLSSRPVRRCAGRHRRRQGLVPRAGRYRHREALRRDDEIAYAKEYADHQRRQESKRIIAAERQRIADEQAAEQRRYASEPASSLVHGRPTKRERRDLDQASGQWDDRWSASLPPGSRR